MLGGAKLLRAVSELNTKIALNGQRKALLRAAPPFVKAAKRNAPKDTGLLRRSITRRSKTYKQRKTVVVVAGPGTRRTGKTSRGEFYRPANIAHIVERGGKFHKAHPFITPAFNSTHREVMRRYRGFLAEETRKEAKRIGARYARTGR